MSTIIKNPNKTLQVIALIHGILVLIFGIAYLLVPERVTTAFFPPGTDPTEFSYFIGIFAGLVILVAMLHFLLVWGINKGEKNANSNFKHTK